MPIGYARVCWKIGSEEVSVAAASNTASQASTRKRFGVRPPRSWPKRHQAMLQERLDRSCERTAERKSVALVSDRIHRASKKMHSLWKAKVTATSA